MFVAPLMLFKQRPLPALPLLCTPPPTGGLPRPRRASVVEPVLPAAKKPKTGLLARREAKRQGKGSGMIHSCDGMIHPRWTWCGWGL